MTAPEVRTWHAPTDAEWRCAGTRTTGERAGQRCGYFLATLSGDTYTKPNGERGTLPAALKCPRCGHRNHCERIIIRTEYRRT